MDDIYFGFEMTLLTLLVARISLLKFREHWSFDSNEIELFFLICFVNQVWGYFNDDNVYFLHFFHCVAPVVLTLSILKSNVKLIFRFSLLLLVSLNLYFHNLYLIIFSYLFCFVLLVNRAVRFSLKSKNYREVVPLYIAILCLLLLTNLIYLLGFVKMDWTHSQLIHYFSFTIKFVYLSTIILGHVYLRRFIVN